MLRKVLIENFKCHELTTVELNNLTLLLGTNSSGKSTIIQSILLCAHNFSNEGASSPLNGHLVSIGNFNEARNVVTNARSFNIRLISDCGEARFAFAEGEELEEDGKVEVTKSGNISDLLIYSNRKLHYLSANRIGGQDLYTKNFDKYDLFGIFGEYAIDYFEHNKSEVVPETLQANKDSQTLEAQVNYWLKRILNHSITTSKIDGTDKVKAEYFQTASRSIRPKNTGSGVSYTVGIIIMCLSLKPGEIILIENPEIHLHPKAQSELVDFFTMIANAGIQLIVETHSDHIFNGLRVKVFQKEIERDKLSINFFTLDDDFQTNHTKISLSERGRVENPVELLFDQFENDLDTLLGL